MPPAVFLRYPQEILAPGHPFPTCRIVTPAGFHIDPGAVRLLIDRRGFTRRRSTNKYFCVILLAVELLQYQLTAVVRPFHSWYIMLPAVARHLHPDRLARRQA